MVAVNDLVDHETITFYADGEAYLVVNRPTMSDKLARMVASGILSMNEAREICYQGNERRGR